MKLLAAFFTSALASLVGLVLTQTPGTCTGSCEGVSHDPALIQRSSDGIWFRFSTGNGINIATAPDMTGDWTITGEVVSGGDLWAPDVQLIDGTYYLYYASSSFGTQDSFIGLATSTTMDAGTWTDHGSVFTSTTGDPYNAIDPNLIVVDGINKLNFGSFWNDIYQVQVNSDYVTTTGTPLQLAYNASGTHSLEGSYMYFSSPYYFLFFSSGICCGYDTSKPAQGEEYKIMVCRSESALGPFVDANGNECVSSGGTEVLASHDNVYGPGGQGVYEDVLYYHYVDTTVGYADGDKLFGWNTLDFSSGWPVVS